MKKFLTGFFAFLLLIVLVACGNKEEQETENATNPTIEITEEEKVDDDQVVAVINGEEVNGKTYNLVYTQLKLQASHFEEDIDLEEIKSATIESLIDRQLLLQQAREVGIEITDEMVNEKLDTFKSENREAFDTLLAQYQITEEDLKDQLKYELAMNEYINETIEVSVTDKEIEEHYEKAKEGNDEIPELDEIKSNLKSQILNQKRIEELEEKINKVKEKATIEEKI